MFTGIVEELGTLKEIKRGAASAQLTIRAEKVLEDARIGDSIAVNGVCLTVVHLLPQEFTVDVMAETLSKTNLGALNSGDRVNLERALRLGDRLGGHIVSGHIDGVGTITRLEKHDIATLITIRAPHEVMRYIIKKGSVAIDGISLTVVDLQADSFQVSLIPHTAHATALGLKKAGASVNLEGDVIGKYIERLAAFPDSSGGESKISLSFLAEHGFV
ncbi:riboflavin synthase [Pelotomaculum isophthalicicum JI]|uniref:Riboflavin synthase n=1 Tax=Pelotomaculum isophthalicicum JI TaxID=947010 RepID=A0A9X4GYU1_9FIRM|nr:riboflavin synthase [Pelotomaculum isophthalicicum]MDF9408135.1 riboflavin synthase [Pelotomaculum isophthalicicum JI]